MTRTPITEEMGVHKEWAKEVDGMSMEKLPEFLRKLTEDYEHDYGTICHAIACGAAATAKAINRSPCGGITGFQAGAVMWEMIKLWGVFGDGPLRMLCIDDMLYPQYEYKFTSIRKDQLEYLQERAKKLLAENHGVPRVRDHWHAIAAGKIPFGYAVID